jgi:hypothetical protein
MRFSMNKTTTLLAIILAVGLSYSLTPSHQTVSVVDSVPAQAPDLAPPASPPAAVFSPGREPDTGVSEAGLTVATPDGQGNAPADKSVAEPLLTEGSWAKEMRELRELTRRDPQAALTLAAQQPTREERDEALKAVCLQLAQTDPALALTTAWSFQIGLEGNSETDTRALENMANRWAMTDLPTALAWASEQPATAQDARRDWIMKGLASAWAKTSPEAAARLVAEQISPGPVQAQAAMEVLIPWATSDFADATAWAEQFPSGALREMALAKLARQAQPESSASPQ